MPLTRLYTYADDVDTAVGSEVAAEFDNLYNNMPNPDNLDDSSVNAAAMQATRDPYAGSVEVLATSLREEVQALRYLVKQISGESQWYIDPDTDIASLFAGKLASVAKTTTYVATATDGIILCDASGGAFTVTLPTAVGIAGKYYLVKKTDTSSNAVTVDGNGTETIDAVLSKYLRTYLDYVIVYSDGANWNVLGETQFRRIPEYRNLVITNTVATATITATALDVELNSHILRMHSVNVTANIAVLGAANGLDTGTEASNTTYALWVIYNPTTNTVAGLLSLSFTAPSMPSGYTYKRLVGFVRNNSAANFLLIQQQDNRLWYESSIDAGIALSSGNSATWADVDLTTWAGSGALVRQAVIGWHFYTTTNEIFNYAYVRSNNSTGSGKVLGTVRRSTSAVQYGQYNDGETVVWLDTNLIFEYMVSNVNSELNIYVHGVILNL